MTIALGPGRLRVHHAVLEGIRAHARASAPRESVGLVLLIGSLAGYYWQLRNVAPSTGRFQVDAQELAKVLASLAPREVPCLCHSHVTGGPEPSPNDLDNLAWPFDVAPYFVYSVERDELAAWRLLEGRRWERAA